MSRTVPVHDESSGLSTYSILLKVYEHSEQGGPLGPRFFFFC